MRKNKNKIITIILLILLLTLSSQTLVTSEKNIQKTNIFKIKTITYYLRDVDPTHGQPGEGGGGNGDHRDMKAMLLAKPENKPKSEEYWKCSNWIQNSPDEIPEDISKFTIIKDIDIYCWYKAEKSGLFLVDNNLFRPYVAFQRHATPWMTVNPLTIRFIEPVDNDEEYKWTHVKIQNIFCPLFSKEDWYWVSVKLIGDHPIWMTNPDEPSRVEFTVFSI